MKQKINIDEWNRYKPYNFFKTFDNPYASVVSIVNVDNIVKLSKEYDISFYGLMTYIVLKTINEIEAFKYVLEEDEVYRYDYINATCTVIKKNNELNFTRIIEYSDFNDFINKFIKAKEEAESDAIIPYVKSYNKVYITCTPWMRITGLNNPAKYNTVDSVPRICWGKYFLHDNEYYIDLSLQVNHAFQDGYHIGMFFSKLNENITNILKEKEKKKLIRKIN